MNERELVRDLAKQYAEIAALDETKKTAENWGKLNALNPSARPTIMLDQLPGGELNVNGELTCVCSDPFYRQIEGNLKFQLYRYRHFKADMVFIPFYASPKYYSDSGCGVGSSRTDETGHEGAQTHLFADNIPNMEAISKLKNRVIKYNAEATENHKNRLEEAIGDIMPVKPQGTVIWAALWDRIVFACGAEKILYALIDDPDYCHALIKRLADIEMDAIDQLEAQNLLWAGPGAVCHCTETYVDEDKWRNIDQNHIKASDCWISGAAQIFSEVSPAMHDEFEIEYLKPIYDRFGWVNYGCCDPLDKKIDIVRKFKTVRGVSASPWTNVYMQAEAMGKDLLMYRKPNPAYVASGYVMEDAVRKEIRETLKACTASGTPVAFILKDVTTVGNRPQCLTEWYEIVKSEIENF